jgi:hypothetical protein
MIFFTLAKFRRREIMPMPARADFSKLHASLFPRGAHCSENGVFVDNVPLLRKLRDPRGGIFWVPRDPAALDLDLGAGYCLPVDANQLTRDLSIVADALNNWDVAAARAALVRLRLPAFPQRHYGRLGGMAQRRLAEELRAILLLREERNKPTKGRDHVLELRRHHGDSLNGSGGQFGCQKHIKNTSKYNLNWAQEARDQHGRWTGTGEDPVTPIIGPYSTECLAAINAAKELCFREYAMKGGRLGFEWIRRCIRKYVPEHCGY